MNIIALIAVAFSIFSSNPVTERNAKVYTEIAQMNNVEMPAVRVRVVNRDCPLYGDGSRVSCVYRAKPDRIFTSQTEPFVLLHELGHVYDFSHTMRPWQRLAFRIVMRYYDLPWHSTTRIGASERFADAYAGCALGLSPPDESGVPSTSWIQGGYGYKPTPEQHRRVCEIIAPRR
jgi:hypothetical protein